MPSGLVQSTPAALLVREDATEAATDLSSKPKTPNSREAAPAQVVHHHCRKPKRPGQGSRRPGAGGALTLWLLAPLCMTLFSAGCAAFLPAQCADCSYCLFACMH